MIRRFFIMRKSKGKFDENDLMSNSVILSSYQLLENHISVDEGLTHNVLQSFGNYWWYFKGTLFRSPFTK